MHSNLAQNLASLVEDSDYNALVGYKAFDQDLGILGPVIDYVQNEFNSVFVIDFHGRELLIPAVEEFINH